VEQPVFAAPANIQHIVEKIATARPASALRDVVPFAATLRRIA